MKNLSILHSPFSILHSPLSILHVLNWLVVFSILPNLTAQQFSLSSSPGDNLEFEGYCDHVTFTITITNNTTSSDFDVYIAPYTDNWEYTDFGNLPDQSPSEMGEVNVLEFTTPAISATAPGNTLFYTWTMRATTWQTTAIYPFLVTITKKSNNATLGRTYDLSPDENKNTGLNDFTLASDIIDDYFNNPSLFELSGGQAACNSGTTQHLYVPEEIIFDVADYCIYNNDGTGNIIMEEGARLVVADGTTLTIDGQLISSCHKMWKGIKVEAGGILRLNDVTIENAQYAIQAERGATLSVQNCSFINNYVGLYVSPFAYVGDPENPQESYVFLELFHNNHFKGVGAMLPGYSGQTPAPQSIPYAGIELHNLSSFSLPGDVESSTEGFANFFENLSNGVIADNTSLSVGDAYFKDIESVFGITYTPQGYGIYVENGKHLKVVGTFQETFEGYEYHFEDVDNAIYSQGGSALVQHVTMNAVGKGIFIKNTYNRTLDLLDNTITATDKGILLMHNVPVRGDVMENTISIDGNPMTAACIEIEDLGGDSKWNIEENTITIIDGLYGIIHRSGEKISIKNNPSIEVIPETADIAYGIFLENSRLAEIYCNTLLTDEITTTYPDFWGIYSSSALEFMIRCNTLTNFKYGLNFSGNNMRCYLLGNTIGKQWDGLLLGLDPDYGFAIIGIQNLAGNLWTEAEEEYDNLAARHLGTPEIVRRSPFTYNTNILSNGNPLSEPPSIFASAKWFEDLMSNDLFECEGINGCPAGSGFTGHTPTWDSLDLAVSNGDLGFEYFDPSLSWQGRLHTYRKLKNVSHTLLPDDIDDFIEENEFLPIGLFAQAFDSLNAFLRYDGPQAGVLTDFPAFVTSRFSRIAELDGLLYEDPGNDSLLALKILVQDSILLLEINYLQKTNYIAGILEAGLERLISSIESISPDSIWEENLKFTLLETIDLALNDELTSSQDLYDLALSCPDYFGPGVYQARSLIRQDSTLNYYDHYNLCMPLTQRSVTKDHQNRKLTLYAYPNPSSDLINVVVPSGTTSLFLSNLYGSRYDIEKISKTIRIDLGSYPPGGYWITAETAKGERQTLRFVLID